MAVVDKHLPKSVRIYVLQELAAPTSPGVTTPQPMVPLFCLCTVGEAIGNDNDDDLVLYRGISTQ